MNYSFDVDIAKKYGVDEAVMIANLQYWIRQNRTTGINLHDGRHWTYNTLQAYAEIFPFWNKDRVRRILESLVAQKVVLKGNYNKLSFDRTSWYAFADEEAFCGDVTPGVDTQSEAGGNAKEPIHVAEVPHPSGRTAPTIPVNKPVKKEQERYIQERPGEVFFMDSEKDMMRLGTGKDPMLDASFNSYTAWKRYKNLKAPGPFTQNIKTAYEEARQKHSPAEIDKAYDNYSTVLSLPTEYFFTYGKWSLSEFLRRGLDKFVDKANPLIELLKNKGGPARPQKKGKLTMADMQ